MPKAAKAKQTTRANPLQKTDGNTTKKKSDSTNKSGAKAASEDQGPSVTEATASAASTSGEAGTTTATNSNKPTKRPQGRENLGANYIFLSRLSGTRDPVMTRLLTVPPDLTFHGMHEVMQVAFGWANCHHWWFKVSELLSIQEMRTKHPKQLIYIENATMFDPPTDEEHENSAEWILADVFDNERYAGKVEVIYEYDMGDSWEHDIVFIGREAPGMRKAMMIPEDAPIACLGGEGHPCAEDAGSYPGWEYLKEVFTKARSRDPADKERKEWYKTMCSNGDPKGLDPYKWDVIEVNQGLDEINKLRMKAAAAQNSA